MDTWIRNGLIYDGSGSSPFRGSLFIRDDRIAAVIPAGAEIPAALKTAPLVIDAAGRCITPGFIDQHRHADLAIFRDSFGPQELAQGLTTINTGVCGFSYAPFTEKSELLYTYAEPIMGPSPDGARYPELTDYIEAAGKAKLALNASTLQGLGAIRIAVKGYDPSPYTEEEMKQAQELVEKAMDAGVRGFSTGLVYNPEMYTSTEEMTRLLEPCKGRDMLFMPHMRSEAGALPEAVDEVIGIAEHNEMALSISHFKAIGPKNWHGKLEEAIGKIEKARDRGTDVTVDVYPYHGTATTLSSKLPFSFLTKPFDRIIAEIDTKEETDRLRRCYLNPGPKDNTGSEPEFMWNTTLITGVALAENEKYLGLTVNAAFEKSGCGDVYEFLAGLLHSERGSVTMIELAMDDADIERIMRLPYSMIISDSLYDVTEHPHPRAWAMCPHMIREYVLNRKVLSMEEAVRKMSFAQAQRMRYKDRGILREGAFADVLVFAPENLGDHATFDNGKQISTGMEYVFINGTPVWKDETMLARAGRYLVP